MRDNKRPYVGMMSMGDNSESYGLKRGSHKVAMANGLMHKVAPKAYARYMADKYGDGWRYVAHAQSFELWLVGREGD